MTSHTPPTEPPGIDIATSQRWMRPLVMADPAALGVARQGWEPKPAVQAIRAPAILAVSGVDKSFTMHLQGGQRLPVLRELAFEVHAGECVALGGASGSGKSSILKMVYGNYAVDRGRILLRAKGRVIDIAAAGPRQVLAARRDAVGYVSQFLRCVPRVPALQIVAEPLLQRGVRAAQARDRAAELLARLAVPERLWALPPATFSGGEQQRVNIARGFVAELIREKLARGTAILGIFHDAEVREAVAGRVVAVEMFAAPAGAAA